ncbi:hypothetical protein BDF14DRAFT_1991502 [Spinellus fusiger]|nr:hypothetical protein BDF14DRAFT_1991502 [Spinellus fusiger]
MSARKSSTGGGYGRGSQKYPRDTNRRNEPTSSRSTTRSTLDTTTGESRAIQLLRRILLDEDDHSYSRRSTSAAQLVRLLGESRHQDSEMSPNRQERGQLLEYCLHGVQGGTDILVVFEVAKAPRALKQSVVNILSSLACSIRLDVILGCLFDYLSHWKEEHASPADACKEREVKMWLLHTLRQITVDTTKDPLSSRQLEELSLSVLTNLITFLDAMDSADYLPDILDIFVAFSKNYKQKFATKFEDIIDLLVGWHIDTILPDTKRVLLKDAYKAFKPYWNNRLSFAFELLYHFLNDMRSHIIDFKSNQYEINESQKKCDVFHSLLSCFFSILETVVLLIPTVCTPQETVSIGEPFDQLRLCTLDLICATKDLSDSHTWDEMSNQALMTMISIRQDTFRPHQEKLYQHLISQLPENSGREMTDPIKYVETLTKLVNAFQASTEEFIVYDLLNIETSPLYRLKYAHRDNDQLSANIITLLRLLICLCDNVKFQKDITHCLMQSLHHSMTTLCSSHSINNKSRLDKITRAVSMDTTLNQYDILSLEASTESYVDLSQKAICTADIMFFNYLILESALSWTSLAKQNTLFSLQVLSRAWDYRCADVFNAHLFLLKRFWTRCRFSLESPDEFALLRNLLEDLTSHWTKLELKTRQFVCSFVSELLSASVPPEQVYFATRSSLRTIILCVISALDSERNDDVLEKMLRIIIQYCQLFGSVDTADATLIYVQSGIFSPCSAVQKASIELLSTLNPFVFSEVAPEHDKILSLLQTMIMASPHTGAFRPVHYEITMRHLGMGDLLLSSLSEDDQEQFSQEPKPSLEWARRLFYHCDALGSMKHMSSFIELQKNIGMDQIISYINKSSTLLFYWAMWESARYCILSRLRTPFGNPQQTFAALERTLNNLVSAPENTPGNKHHLRYLLLLLDRLEVQIYNASEGCSTNALPSVPRPSVVFFKTNKKTCIEYFARIRPNIVKGAIVLHNHSLVIRGSLEILDERDRTMQEKFTADPLTWFSETNILVRDLVHACIQQHSPDIIHGLQSWYKKIIRKATHILPSFQEKWSFECFIGPLPKKQTSSQTASTSWFQVASLFSTSKYEAAIKTLQSIRKHVENDDYGILDMLDEKLVEFYACLEDYDSIKNLSGSHFCSFGDMASKELEAFIHGQPLRSKSRDSLNFTQYFQTAPLNSCLSLGELSKFRQWISRTEEPGWNAQISSILSQRIISCLQEGLFSYQSSILELQLQNMSWKSIYNDAKYWIQTISNQGSTHYHHTSDTKCWARLATCFSRLFTQYGDIHSDTEKQCLIDVQLHAAKAARKQGNFTTASYWVEKCSEIQENSAQILYEHIKILLAEANYSEAIEMLDKIVSSEYVYGGTKELESKVYLKMAKLLKNTSEKEAETMLNTLEIHSITGNNSETQSAVELAIDTALEKALEMGEDWDIAWFEYATHYYKQGWRILDEMIKENPSMPIVVWAHNKITDALIATMSHSSSNSVDYEQSKKALLETLHKYSGAVGICPLKRDPAFIRTVQQLVPWINESTRSTVLDVLDVLQESILSKFSMSVNAYFHYLTLSKDSKKYDDTDDEDSESTSMTITTTLRLVRMLTKYGNALYSTYTEHIETVCITPWKQIIPQLFARLSHPAECVRQLLSRLISRICDEYPSEIIYEVIVSSTSSKTNKHTKQSLDAIAAHMMAKNNELWNSTRRMAEELEKITVLWEEKWLNRIASLQFDVMQQYQKLEQEITRLKQSGLLDVQREKSFKESYESVMKFVILSIEKMLSTTIMGSISTPHEQWFENTFGNQIREALHMLQKPESIKDYRKGWDHFQQLHRQLMMETQKVRILELNQLSPYLASMKNTVVSIPGIHEEGSDSYIDTFGSTVIVLPTKTKPKKLDLMGTDGKKYSYLFKGLEDLHLDERIMQLLNTTNGLLQEDKSTASRKLKARTYAVIPLSDHSGMIQWVNDATPVFASYKRWQKHEHATQMLITNDKLEESVAQALLRRPTENFMDKVAEILKAEGLRVTANRRHWPKQVLKKAYMKLVKETPRELMSKELWCSSSDATEWLSKSVSFSRSLAVMSIVGYIIGLGDRHLDNIMVDYYSGEVIHIDYNVCFEKGKRLRVPELVPYRLSQNLYHALGITGADGVFRAAAEETLRVLRKHKEVFITLLDAFVYDPLVDWENEAEEMRERQVLEIQANLGLIASRLNEKKPQYDKYQTAVTNVLSLLSKNVQQAHQTLLAENKRQTQEEINKQKFNNAIKLRNEADNAKKRVLSILSNCREWHEKHKSIINAIKTPQLDSLFSKKYVLEDSILLAADKQGAAYNIFSDMVSVWTKQRDAVYCHCFDEIRNYRRILQPLIRNTLEQDCHGIYSTMLNELVQQGYKQSKVDEILSSLVLDGGSEVLQSIDHRASAFSSHILHYIKKVESFAETNQHTLMERKDNVDTAMAHLYQNKNIQPCIVEVLSNLLFHLENDIRKFSAEKLDMSNDEDIEPNSFDPTLKQETLEDICYFNCFTRSHSLSQTSLCINLREHVEFFRNFFNEDTSMTEIGAIDALVSCTSALYQLEESCLTICNTVFEYLQTVPQCIERLIKKLEHEVEMTTGSGVRDIVQVNMATSTDLKLLLNTIQTPFQSMDILCKATLKMTNEYGMAFGEIDGAVEKYIRMKNSVLLCILQEAVEQYKAIVPGTWVSPLILSWNLTRNATISQALKSLVHLFSSSIIAPMTMTIIDVMNGYLDMYASKTEGNDYTDNEKYLSILQEQCKITAEISIIDMANTNKENYESYLRRFELDTARFHWFNALNLQMERPLAYSKLTTSMVESTNKLINVGTGLGSLKEIFGQLEKALRKSPDYRSRITKWEGLYNEEVKNHAILLNCYTCITHFESSRVGFEEAMNISKNINDVLRPLATVTTNTETAENSNIFSPPIPVPTGIISRVEEKLIEISTVLSELRSPTDGIVLFLESVLIVETEADNELKPAQQSAKVTLDELSNIEKHLNTLGQQKQKATWTFDQLNFAIDSVSTSFFELFGSLRTLEGFGLDNKVALQGEAQKPAEGELTESIDDDMALLQKSHEDSDSSDQDASASQRSIYADRTSPSMYTSPLVIGVEKNTASDTRVDGHSPVQDETGEASSELPAQIQELDSLLDTRVMTQRRNVHVLGIMRRIKAKLDGKDFGVQHRMTISEQVARTIEQAISVDNMSLMYEGWTSWV